jgi:hypothetical protein
MNPLATKSIDKSKGFMVMMLEDGLEDSENIKLPRTI